MAYQPLHKFVFQTPAAISIAGASRSGKTTFVLNLLKHRRVMFSEPPKNVYFVFSYAQPFFREHPDITFTRSIPTPRANSLIIVDDAMFSRDKLRETAELFIGGSHHNGTSVIFISQYAFIQDPAYRVISLNSTALILFRSPRISQQVQTLSRQIFGSSEKLSQIYRQACQRPHSYIVLDLSQTCPDTYRVRSHILPHEGFEVVYET